jgi:hypothetical protein
LPFWQIPILTQKSRNYFWLVLAPSSENSRIDLIFIWRVFD